MITIGGGFSLRLAEALEDHVAGAGSVGLAAGRLHDRPDKGAHSSDFPRSDLVGHLEVGGDRLVNGGGQHALVAHHGARAATTSSGFPSPARTPSITWRASLSLRAPDATSAATRATAAGLIARSARSVPDSFARRASSPSHHLRASAGDAPAATVCSTRSSAPALRMAAMSSAGSPHSRSSLAWRAAGSSGSDFRISSTHSREGASGTRSGSGKER